MNIAVSADARVPILDMNTDETRYELCVELPKIVSKTWRHTINWRDSKKYSNTKCYYVETNCDTKTCENEANKQHFTYLR